MVCKYKLDINGLVYQFGDECIRNWDEISYALKRKDHGGTLSSFSSSFQFVGEAYDLLMNEYISSYLNANASVTIYTIENDMTFRNLYTARLDFGSMRASKDVLSINSFDDSVSGLLKAKGNTQYEFPVSELNEPQELQYDRILMQAHAEWIDGCTADDGEWVGPSPFNKLSYIDINPDKDATHLNFPLSIKDSELPIKNRVEFNDVLDYDYSHYFASFITVNQDAVVHVKIHFNAKCTHNSGMRMGMNIYLAKYMESSMRLDQEGDETIVSWSMRNDLWTPCIFEGDISMKEGQSLSLNILIINKDRINNRLWIADFTEFSVKLNVKGDSVGVGVIKPEMLLNKLLNRISDGTLTGAIDTSYGGKRLADAMLLPAESARGIEGAKAYTSYKKFCEWMSAVFGYVPVISGKTVRFVHRDTLFSNNAAIEAGQMIEDVDFAVDNGMIYSSVKVGYDKKDYDSANGRDEFRWTNEFDTGIDIKSSTLSLISPYRADAYGIELLVEKRGEETSDTNSDTDMFFVGASLSRGNYKLDRNIQITGVISPDTMFNVMYSPRSIIAANERYIASSINRLVFASSDGNSDVVIGGTRETADFIVSNGLFSASVLKFKSANSIPCPDDNLIKVSNGKQTYEGYVQERTCKYGRYDGVEYKLLVKSIR